MHVRNHKGIVWPQTSTRQQSSCVGDTLREMGFMPSRADPDLLMKKSPFTSVYDHVGTFVDDLIVAFKEPIQCLEALAQKINLRNVIESPSFFLGANWVNNENTNRMQN